MSPHQYSKNHILTNNRDCAVYPQLSPLIEASWGCSGTLRRSLSPARYGSLSAHLTRLRALCQGTPATRFDVLQVTLQQSSLVFFNSRIICRVLSSWLVKQEQNSTNRNQPNSRLETSKHSMYFSTALNRHLRMQSLM